MHWAVTLFRPIAFSPNHPIRSRQHVGRNREADLFGGFEVDHQLELGRLLDCCRWSNGVGPERADLFRLRQW